MFSKMIRSILFLCLINFAVGTFRCDYTYISGADGWYKLHNVPAHWHLAKELCEREGGDLVKPDSPAMVKAISRLMQEQGIDTPVYTGYRVIFTLEEEPDTKHLYDNEIPTQTMTFVKEQVIVIWSNGTLEQRDTFMWYPFICQIPASETFTITQCGTFDSDYILDKRTDHCYKFHRERHSWYDARRVCAAEGGNLAIINSELEAEVIKDVFFMNPAVTIPGHHWKDSAFVGVMMSNDMVWVTSSGETLSSLGYEGWSLGEPNNANGDEFCGSVGRNGRLFDDPCSRPLPFICELERDSMTFCDGDKKLQGLPDLLKDILRGNSSSVSENDVI